MVTLLTDLRLNQNWQRLEKHASLFCPSIRWDEVNYFGTGALSSSTKSWSSSPSPSLSTLLLVTSLLSSLLLEVHWPILSSNDDYDDFMVRSPPLSNSSRVVLSTWVAAVATHLSIGIGRQPQSWVSRRFSFSSCETKRLTGVVVALGLVAKITRLKNLQR